MTITYKQNNIEDLEEIFRISSVIFNPSPQEIEKHQNKDDWTKKIKNGGILITAYSDNTLVGFAICRKNDSETLHIWNVGVLPQFRKKGIWQEMYRQITTYAKDNGFVRITLNTFKSLFPEMYSFAQKEGFSCYETEMEERRGKMIEQTHFEKKLHKIILDAYKN